MTWAGSTRRDRLPPDWRTRIVPQIKRRDRGLCQWPTENGICGHPGTDVDHRIRGDDHRLANLWLLCQWHHQRKTAAEAAAARGPAVSERRPPEQHPGLA